MDKVIDEPVIDASCCLFYSPNSEQIKNYYNFKYPNVYILSPSTVLEQLDDEQVFSNLKDSVKSFIKNVTQSYKLNRVQDPAKKYSELERSSLPIYDSSWATLTVNSEKQSPGNSADIFKISTSATDFSVYDSVHSIKVPLRTYEKKSRLGRQLPRAQSTPSGSHSSVAEVTKQMSSLVFDRVEKPVPLPLRYKSTCSTRKDRRLGISPYSRKQAGSSSSARKNE